MWRATSFLFFCCVLSLPNCSADQAEFLQAIRETEQRFSAWSARIDAREFLVRKQELDDIVPADWKNAPPRRMHAVRIVRDREKCRIDVEQLGAGGLSRSSRSWDGMIERFRDAAQSYNSTAGGASYHCPRSPHRLLINAVEEGFFSQFGYPYTQPKPRVNFDFADMTAVVGLRLMSVSKESLDGCSTWRLDFQSSRTGASTQVWMSREHDLLPILEQRRQSGALIYQSKTTSFQQAKDSEGRTRWFPEGSQVLSLTGGPILVRNYRWQVLTDESDGKVFSSINIATPAMLGGQKVGMVGAVPPPAATSPALKQFVQKTPLYSLVIYKARRMMLICALVIPILIILWVSVRQRRLRKFENANPWHASRNWMFILVGLGGIVCLAAASVAEWRIYGGPGLIALIPIIYLVWRRAESTDIPTPDYRVRTIYGIAGAVCTIAIYVSLCQVQSWGSHGVAAALAGVFGLLWYIVMQCFIRSRRFSIISILSLATCLALIMSGYQSATRQIRARQEMIDTLDDIVDASYGFVKTRSSPKQLWIETPEGLRIPRFAARALGKASTGAVHSIQVPSYLFVPQYLRRWDLSQLRSVSVVVSSENRPSTRFRVSAAAISSLPKHESFDSFHCEGAIDAEGLAALSKLPGLKTVGFNLYGSHIPPELKDLPAANHLQLSNIQIDADATETLADLKKIGRLTFSNLTVLGDSTKATRFPVGGKPVELIDTEITPDVVRWLSDCGFASLSFNRCTFSKDFANAATELGALVLQVENTAMNNAELLALVKSSKSLGTVYLSGTRVTAKALDQCSQIRSDIEINLR